MTIHPNALRFLKWLGWGVLGLLILVFLSLGAVITALHTQAGRDKVASLVNELASSESMTISLENLRAAMPWDLRLGSLTLADAGGVWLSANDLDVGMDLAALVGGAIAFDRITLEQVVYLRAPLTREPPEEEPPAQPFSLELPKIPPLRVDTLRVGRAVLHLPPPEGAAQGEVKTFTCNGLVRPEGPDFVVRLDVDEVPGPDEGSDGFRPDKLSLEARLRQPDNILAVDASLEEGSGGLLGQALGVDAGTAISGGLRGTGSLEHWLGEMRLNVGRTALLSGTVNLRLEQDAGLFRAALKGHLQDPASLLPPDIVRLSGDNADFDLAVTLPLDGRLAELSSLDTCKLVSPTFSLSLAASMRDAACSATLTLDILDPAILPHVTSDALAGKPTVAASLEGDEDKAVLELRAGLGALTMPDLTSNPATLHTVVTLGAPLDPEKREIAAKGTLRVDGLQAPRDYTLDQALELAFDLGLNERTQQVHIASLTLNNGENTLQANGEVDIPKQQVQAHVEAELPHAGALMTLTPLDAAISLKADATGAMAQGIDAAVTMDLSRIKGLDPQVAALLGDSLNLAAKAFVDEKHVQLHGLDVKGRTSLTASGVYTMEGRALDAMLTVTPPETLTLPGDPAPLQVQGLAPLDLTAKGSLQERLDVTARSRADKAILPGRSFTGLALDLAAGVPLRPQSPQSGDELFSLDLKTDQIGLIASSRYRLLEKILELSEINVRGPETSIRGALRLAMDSTLLNGAITIEAKRLAAYADLLGLKLQGAVKADVDLSAPAAKQGVRIKAEARDAGVPEASVRSLAVQAQCDDVYGAMQGAGTASMRLQATHAGTPDAYAEDLLVNAAMAGGAVQLDLKTNGRADKPFDVAVKATVKPAPERIEARIASLAGSYDALPFKLAAPATIIAAGGGVTVQGLHLGVAGAEVRADGAYGPADADLKASVLLSDLGLLRKLQQFDAPALSGSVTVETTLKGALAAPRVHVAVRADDVEMEMQSAGPEAPQPPELPPLDLRLEADLGDGRLAAKANLAHKTTSLADLELTVPVKLALQPFAFELAESAPLNGALKGGLDLDMFKDALAVTDQIVQGHIDFNLAIGGRLDDPDVEGHIGLKKGRYENLKLGTLLTDIVLQLEGKGDTITITQLSANDGGGGSVKGQGSVDLDGDFPFQAAISMDMLTPVQMDIFKGTLSGTVDVRGNAKDGADVTGKLDVDHAIVLLPKSLPPDITDIRVIQDDGSESAPPLKDQAAAKPVPVRLDITILMPGQIYVRGKGLDSEWNGKLHIGGSANDPRITGKLGVSRGTFDFLDNVFNIDEGELRFAGGSPPSPVINVVTSSQANDILAKVTISGTIQYLSITLSSEPPRPDNEILAAVLFGKPLDKITPLQAVRLARAVDQITGSASGYDIEVMQNLKRMLGVDELSAGEGASGDMVLQAGKHITDDVYVKGTKGLDPRDDSLSVEVEITPHLGLETEMGADSQSGIGLNWRMDY